MILKEEKQTTFIPKKEQKKATYFPVDGLYSKN
jgi:hypothetical protein